MLPFVHARRRRLSTRKTRSACRYRNGGFHGRAGGRVYIDIFVTVMVATGIMSPVSQKASNSPHAIIEMGLAESSIMSSAVNVVPASEAPLLFSVLLVLWPFVC